jgi:heptosyltransferase-2
VKKKVLIIKLGYCETLVNETGFVPSLGDVFRHTVLLHYYANDEVTWLTSASARPLLEDNPYIHEIITFQDGIDKVLAGMDFDEVLCLEKSAMLCDIADSIKCTRRLGFKSTNGSPHACRGAEPAIEIANGRDSFLPIQAHLYQMVDAYWNGEKYVLGYQPKTKEQFDVGFNFRVGSKWPSKQWPEKHWKQLERYLLKHNLSVSWQKGESDLKDYIDWIASNRLIVTGDSLGMHLGLAVKKKVIALFGPTPSEQIYMYGMGVILSSEWACPKAPCMKAKCDTDHGCMKEITPRIVARTISNLLNGKP